MFVYETRQCRGESKKFAGCSTTSLLEERSFPEASDKLRKGFVQRSENKRPVDPELPLEEAQKGKRKDSEEARDCEKWKKRNLYEQWLSIVLWNAATSHIKYSSTVLTGENVYVPLDSVYPVWDLSGSWRPGSLSSRKNFSCLVLCRKPPPSRDGNNIRNSPLLHGSFSESATIWVCGGSQDSNRMPGDGSCNRERPCPRDRWKDRDGPHRTAISRIPFSNTERIRAGIASNLGFLSPAFSEKLGLILRKDHFVRLIVNYSTYDLTTSNKVSNLKDLINTSSRQRICTISRAFLFSP